MRLRIVTPLAVVVDEDGVLAVRAEDSSGSFGILPRPCRFPHQPDAFGGQLEARRFEPALLRGPARRVFRDRRREVAIATREAVVGDDLATLDQSGARAFSRGPRSRAIRTRRLHASAACRHSADHAAFAAGRTRRRLYMTPPETLRTKTIRSIRAARLQRRNATGAPGSKANRRWRAGWRKSACLAG